MILEIPKAGMRINFRASILRSTALAALAAVGMIGSPSAFAQAQAGGEQTTTPEVVEVTGTRIVRDGYSAPTPLTVVGPEQLESSATGNLADYVNTIPAFFGSQTPQNSTHASSSAQAGLNVLNLRNLGGVRTLVLMDGQRSVGSTTTGLIDINNIPQDLVSRVDIVTGGASAAYGSDALAGVVNFVLNKTYEGTKVDLSGGLTTYGDDQNWRLRITEGIGFAGDRGHLIASGEISDDYGIKGVPRAWNNTGRFFISNPAYTATNGQPQILNVNQASLYTATFGGIITNTALAGTQFGPGGTPRMFTLGSIVSNPYTVGGDWASNQADGLENLDPAMYSQRIFARGSYEITDDLTVFGQFSWAGTHSTGVNEPIFQLGNITVKSDNAFIPAAVASRLTTLGISQFNMGTLNGDLPPWTNDVYRTTSRFVAGAEGKFDALGSNWSWNAYFQEGDTVSQFRAHGVTLNARYNLAIDAVRSPTTGAIVCRSTLTNPSNGCVPYDLFGTGVNNQAAINYLEPTSPTQHLALKEDVWSGQITGEPFSDWAGPVSLATGVEHRREAVNVTSDPFAGGWFGANYIPVKGSYAVTEGFVETVVPIAKDAFWAKSLDFNAAVRATDYSTAGFVTTWKGGVTWDIIPDIRIRATRSRDIRAPNLSELFQTGAGGTATVQDDFHGRVPVTNTGVATGNLALKPETADGTGAGIVVQPSFLPGFSASADYWEIDIHQAIGSITAQQTIDLCFQGNQELCSRITPNLAALTSAPAGVSIVTKPINLASQKASGIDFEATYRFDLSDVISDWKGDFALRYLGTHYITNITNNGLTPPAQQVGAAIPKWRNNITASYSNQPFTMSLTGRLESSGIIDPTYITCSSGCPAATINNPTVDNNYQPGAFYLDTSLTYDFVAAGNTDIQVYFNVQNLLNKDPAIVPISLNGTVPYISLQTNASLYDVLGRTFRLGVRLNM